MPALHTARRGAVAPLASALAALALAACGSPDAQLPAPLSSALAEPGLAVGGPRAARLGDLRHSSGLLGGSFEAGVKASEALPGGVGARAGAGHRVRLDERSGRVEVERGDGRGALAVELTGSTLGFGAGHQRDQGVVYPARGGDAALVLTPTTHGLKEDLVLARPAGDSLELAFRLVTGAGQAARMHAGSIEIADTFAGGRPLYLLPAPVVRDASGAQVKGVARFLLEGNRLRLVASGLARLRYPVNVDPSIVVVGTASLANPGADEGGAEIAGDVVRRTPIGAGPGVFQRAGGLPQARAGAGLAWYGGTMYLCGGRSANGTANSDVLQSPLDTDGTFSDNFTNSPIGSGGRDGAGCAAWQGWLYVAGGRGTDSGPTADVRGAPIAADGTLGAFVPLTPLPSPRSGHYLAAAAGYLYSVGGADDSGPLAEVWMAPILASGQLGAWRQGPALPGGRTGAVGAVADDHLFVFAGYGSTYRGTKPGHVQLGSGNLGDGFSAAIDPATGTLAGWVPLTSLPQGAEVVNAIGGASGGSLYLLGGEGDGDTQNTWSAPIRGDGTIGAWRPGQRLDQPHTGGAAFFAAGSVYAVGGVSDGAASEAIEAARLDQLGTLGAWRKEPDLDPVDSFPSGRSGHASFAWDGWVYALGGVEDSGEGLEASQRIQRAPINDDGSLGAWADIGSLPTRLLDSAWAQRGPDVYLLGGESDGPDRTVRHAQLGANGTFGVWSSVGTLPSPRDGAAAFIYADRLWVLGGVDPQSDSPLLADGISAPIDPSGSIGAFTPATASSDPMPSPRAHFTAFARNGRVYAVGGDDGSDGGVRDDVISAPLSPDGTIGAWLSGSLPRPVAGGLVRAIDGTLLVAGGVDGDSGPSSADSSAWVAPIDGDGAVGQWQQTTDIPQPATAAGGAIANGRLYVSGGTSGGLGDFPQTDVKSFPVVEKGQLGPWSNGGLDQPRTEHEAVVAAGQVYLLGGYDDSWNLLASVSRSPVLPDGTLDGFGPAGGLNQARGAFCAVAASGRVWALGGWGDGGTLASIESAPIGTDGSLGDFTTADTTLPQDLGDQACAVLGNRVYVVGGYSTGRASAQSDDVVMADLLPDGTITPFRTAGLLPAHREDLRAAIHDRFLYVIGGYTENGNDTSGAVWVAPILADGTLGAFVRTTDLGQDRGYFSTIVVDDHLYAFGGYSERLGRNLMAAEAAPFLAAGGLGTWQPVRAFTRAGPRESPAAVVLAGRIHLLGGDADDGEDGSYAVDDDWSAQVQGTVPRAAWSRLFDLGGVSQVSAITLAARGNGAISLQLSPAGSDGVFQPPVDLGAVATGRTIPLALSNARWLRVRAVIDDSGAAAVDPDADNQTRITSVGLSWDQVFSPSSLDFGALVVDEGQVFQAVTLKNLGAAPMQVTGAEVDCTDCPDTYSFYLYSTDQGDQFTLASAGAATWYVYFDPGTVGTYHADFVVHTQGLEDSTIDLTLPVTGAGVNLTSDNEGPLAFGDQQVGTQSESQSVTVTNPSSYGFQVDSAATDDPDDFIVTNADTQLAGNGGTAAFAVAFKPKTRGPHSGNLVINFSGGTFDAYQSSTVSIPLTGNGLDGVPVATPASVDFGRVATGSSQGPRSVVVTNSGDVDFTIESVGLDAAGTGFAVNALEALPVTIDNDGASLAIGVTFAPVAAGAVSVNLVVTTTSGRLLVPLSGTGMPPVPTTSPGALAFGAVAVGTISVPKAVMVNDDTEQGGDLTVRSFALDPPGAPFSFQAPDTPFVVPAGGSSAGIGVSFAPTAAGAASAALVIVTDTATLRVQLTGTGELPSAQLSPDSLAFGDVAVGATSAAKLSSLSDGSEVAALHVQSLALDAAGTAAGFAFAAAATPFTVTSGSPAQVSVTFTPAKGGAASANLLITTDGGNLTLVLTGNGAFGVPQLDPAAVAFGAVPVGDTAGPTAVSLVDGSAAAPLHVQSVALDAAATAAGFAFTAPQAPFTVSSGTPAAIGVSFASSRTGAVSGNLVVTTDGGTLQLPLAGTGIAQRFSFDPAALDLGQVVSGQVKALPLTLKNLGDGPVQVRSFTFGGADAQAFYAALVVGQLPVTVPGGGTLAITAGFTAGPVGARRATLGVQSDDAAPGLSLALSAESIAPDLAVQPLALAFGKQRTGTTSAAKTATLTNSGKAPLTLGTVTLSGTGAGRFQLVPVSGLPRALAAGATLDVQVAYAPAAVAQDAATLHFVSDGVHPTADVALTGEGTAPSLNATPLALSFPATRVGALAEPLAVLLSNAGGASGALRGVAVTGAAAADFKWVGAVPLPVTLPDGGGALQLLVQFTPSTAGDRSATLALDTESGPVQVTLAGTGTAGKLAVAATSVDFGAVATGATKAATLTVSNTGNGPLRISFPTIDGAGADAFRAARTGAANGPFELAAAATADLALSFAPRSGGDFAAALHLTSPDGDALDVQLKGSGVSPKLTADASVDFGSGTLGSAVRRTVHLANTGTLDVQVVGLQTDQVNFVAGGTALPLKIAAGGSVDVALAFVPTQEGQLSGSLSIFVSGQDTVAAQVTLTGLGVKLKTSGCASSPEGWLALLALVPFARPRRKRAAPSRAA